MAEPVFVYLHGFASGPGSNKARFFAEKFAAAGVPLELPDLNEGEGAFRGLTLSRSLAQVRAILDAKGAERAVLIGSSLGGYVAALAAAKDPRVEALVLLCPAFDLPARWTSKLGDEGMALWRKARELPVDHHAFGRKEPIGFGLYIDALGHSPYPPVDAPTLILHGVNDEDVPVGTSRKFAEGMPNVRLVEYDSDHGLLDVTEPIWEETRAFLAPWLP
ncbi:alpha/beta hydrolase [Vulgatibacter sp.]|uniref:alpha/beta hydrolase n=1 Tax=Vulgatibacter sp. TaxID=1971226 RepID=UPI003569AC53